MGQPLFHINWHLTVKCGEEFWAKLMVNLCNKSATHICNVDDILFLAPVYPLLFCVWSLVPSAKSRSSRLSWQMTGFLWRHSMSCQTTPSWNRITSSLNPSQLLPELFIPGSQVTQGQISKSKYVLGPESELNNRTEYWRHVTRLQTALVPLVPSLVLLVHSYSASSTSRHLRYQNLDKRFIFCLAERKWYICLTEKIEMTWPSPCRKWLDDSAVTL